MPLVAVVGPTGIGKSSLAIRLAEELGGEIVGADSRQIYRHLDIGTAKPTADERSRVPHHLIDLIDPSQAFGLAEYQELAIRTIRDIHARGRLPLLVGGTGQYVWAVLENWTVPKVPPDPELRRLLAEKADKDGAEELYAELTRLNPEAATNIDSRNVRRVIRALEVTYLGGSTPAKGPALFANLIIGLSASRPELHRRLEVRLNEMIDTGFADEVQNVLESGYSATLPAMSGIGYRQMVQYLDGKLTIAEVKESISVDNHRLVRQQYNWFKPTDERINWSDVTSEPYPDIARLITEFLALQSR